MAKTLTVINKNHPHNIIKADVKSYRKSLQALSNLELDEHINESTKQEDYAIQIKALTRAKKIKFLTRTWEAKLVTDYLEKQKKQEKAKTDKT